MKTAEQYVLNPMFAAWGQFWAFDLPKCAAHLIKSVLDKAKSGLEIVKSDFEIAKSGSDITKSNSGITKSDFQIPLSKSDIARSGSDITKSGFDLTKSDSDIPLSGFQVPLSKSDFIKSDSDIVRKMDKNRHLEADCLKTGHFGLKLNRQGAKDAKFFKTVFLYLFHFNLGALGVLAVVIKVCN